MQGILDRINDRNERINKRISTWRAIGEYSPSLFIPPEQKIPCSSNKRRRRLSDFKNSPTRDKKKRLRPIMGKKFKRFSRQITPVKSNPATTRSSRADLMKKNLLNGNSSTKHSPELRNLISEKLNSRSISISSMNSYPLYCALWKNPKQ